MAHRNTALAGSSERYEGSLRQFLSSVFFAMGVGLAITGAVSMYVASDEKMMTDLFGLTHYVDSAGKEKTGYTMSWLWLSAAIVELAMVIFLSWMGLASKLGTTSATVIFAVFAGLNGVTLAPVLYAYTSESVLRVFFITSAMFAGCALWGHTTKRDLTRFGGFFLAALIGLLIALIVGIFFQSSAFDYAVSCFAVLLFAGLIAYDMQMLEKIYLEERGTYTPGTVIFGALSLYLDFLNMFLHLLRLVGIKVPGRD